jgi:hypothetical protein
MHCYEYFIMGRIAASVSALQGARGFLVYRFSSPRVEPDELAEGIPLSVSAGFETPAPKDG